MRVVLCSDILATRIGISKGLVVRWFHMPHKSNKFLHGQLLDFNFLQNILSHVEYCNNLVVVPYRPKLVFFCPWQFGLRAILHLIIRDSFDLVPLGLGRMHTSEAIDNQWNKAQNGFSLFFFLIKVLVRLQTVIKILRLLFKLVCASKFVDQFEDIYWNVC